VERLPCGNNAVEELMANEFHFSVSLSITHPTADPKMISDVLFSLRPRIQTAAGSECLGKDGKALVPHRRALLTHWLADLHEGERLFSDDIPLSDFILNKLSDFDQFGSLFGDLKKEGQVVLLIGWFSDTNHSAGVLTAEVLKRCGELGIDLEMNFYCPFDS
jgi:hypothetical protein